MSGAPGPWKRPEKPFLGDIDVPPSRAPSEPPRTFELTGRLVLPSSSVVRLGSGPRAPPEARPGTPKGSPGGTRARADLRLWTILDEPGKPSNPPRALRHLPGVLICPPEPARARPEAGSSGNKPYRSQNGLFWARNLRALAGLWKASEMPGSKGKIP